MKIVTVMYDQDIENPSDFNGAWTLHSFNRRHKAFADPEEFFPEGKPSIGLRRKLDVGLAFVLSYSEHGTCQWTRAGKGYSDPWDSVRFAGVLVWEHAPKDIGAKSYEDRAKDADLFLETYTCWANGDGYGYRVEEKVTLDCGHEELREIDSCFGFYGNDLACMKEQIKAAVAGDSEIEIQGEGSGVLDVGDLR